MANDTLEQLRAAQAYAVELEARLAELETLQGASDRVRELSEENAELRARLSGVDVHDIELLRAERDDYSLRLNDWILRAGRLVAVIEKALGEARASSVPLGMPEAAFYRQVLRRVESTLTEARITEGSNDQ